MTTRPKGYAIKHTYAKAGGSFRPTFPDNMEISFTVSHR